MGRISALMTAGEGCCMVENMGKTKGRDIPAEDAPFDRIIVTAAAEDPPGPLLAQLKPGGIMVVPVGQSDAVQSLIRVTRTDSGFDYDELRPVRFVPLLEGIDRGT